MSFRIPVTQIFWHSCPAAQTPLRVCGSDFKYVGPQVGYRRNLCILPPGGSSVSVLAPSLCDAPGVGSSPSNSWFTSPCMSAAQRSPSLLFEKAVTVNLWLMMSVPHGWRRATRLLSRWRGAVEEFAADADVGRSRRPQSTACHKLTSQSESCEALFAHIYGWFYCPVRESRAETRSYCLLIRDVE